MEQTLGSITHYLNLRRTEDAAETVSPRWIPVEYRASRLPWAIAGSLDARRKVRAVADEVDAFFIHTTTLALFSTPWFHKPTVLSTDGTPLNKRGMREWYGLRREGALAGAAKRSIYRRVFGRASSFVAWSNDARRSLVDDYGCRAEDVAVIPPGIDLAAFSPGNRDHALPRILFVGGDFERKGGDVLLDVFRRRLRGRAELELVTRARISPEAGVRVHGDVSANSDALRRLYAESDVFCLPTRADCYPLACMEALAAGLPLVSTSVGGIPDMIEEGRTGHVVPPGDAALLGDVLESLVANPDARAAMGRRAREDAARRFDARENARRLFRYVGEKAG